MIRFIILINILFTAEMQSFHVDFLGINAATVEMHAIDTLYHNHVSKLIHFKTESTGLIKYFFNVNNYYETIIKNNFNTILSFKKNTAQPNVRNNFGTYRFNQQTIYNNSSIIIPKDHFNIFSFLYFLSYNKVTSVQKFHIEREGQFYIGTIVPIKIFNNNRVLYHLELEENHKFSNQPIVEKTDIFTWALFKNNAKREILVDYNINNIVSCSFTTNRINMRAYNTKYNQ